MSKKYNIEVNEIYKDNSVIIFKWSAKGIGFGELIIDSRTHEIIDREYMGDDFCKEVMEIGLSNIKNYFKIKKQ